MNAAVIVAAGRGTRMGAAVNKVLLDLAGIPVIVRSVRAVSESGLFDAVVVVTGEEDIAGVRKLLKEAGLEAAVCAGGADRQESVRRGLLALPQDTGLVAIHDGARPLVTREILAASLESAKDRGSGVAAIPLKDTVKRVAANGRVAETPERASLRAVQTPQSFRYREILEAHERFAESCDRATDDAALLERSGAAVYLSPGSEENLKLTTPQDIAVAERILETRQGIKKQEKTMVRVGHGYDVHRLAEGRKLILCGVEVPYEKGLLGHSDADVAAHALMDALLGAAALGDIGRHFPDTDEAYEGADSMRLLDEVRGMLEAKGFAVCNADITIICQRPKLSPYIEAMRACVAGHLGLPCGCVNVKATTTEHLGFEGEGLGISAHAVCCIEERAHA
ncbi:MAG: 2-C-methyl-D-erythritol 4-phosphate cytidylyltransferase [Clostridia bacterium]|nr:2-C-methyl-D-erythritol 4-phosphate cytidylyltransferase [Clostridia bacterium]